MSAFVQIIKGKPLLIISSNDGLVLYIMHIYTMIEKLICVWPDFQNNARVMHGSVFMLKFLGRSTRNKIQLYIRQLTSMQMNISTVIETKRSNGVD